MNQLLFKLKSDLIEAVGAKNITPDEIGNEDQIFGDNTALELDSLDALELVTILEQNFDLKINGMKASRDIFQSFNKIGLHVLEHASENSVKSYISQ